MQHVSLLTGFLQGRGVWAKQDGCKRRPSRLWRMCFLKRGGDIIIWATVRTSDEIAAYCLNLLKQQRKINTCRKLVLAKDEGILFTWRKSSNNNEMRRSFGRVIKTNLNSSNSTLGDGRLSWHQSSTSTTRPDAAVADAQSPASAERRRHGDISNGCLVRII